MDFLQTALHLQNLDTHPKQIEIQFSKEITPDAPLVGVRLEHQDNGLVFSLAGDGQVAATGRLA